jgi:hypothetical protein
VRAGTIFEDSRLPLGKWLAVIWILANSPSKVSSYEIAALVGITQKSAWMMLRQIRCAEEIGRERS